MTTRRYRKRGKGVKRQAAFYVPATSYKRRRTSNYRTGGYQGMELKFVDIETNSDAFATSWAPMEDGTALQVSGMAQGNSESERIGRKVSLVSIHIKCRVHTLSTEAQANPQPDLFGRICLVWDTQTNGAQLTASEVFDEGGTINSLAFRNLQHTSRFRVLWDKKWVLAKPTQNEGAADKWGIQARTTGIMNYNLKFKTPIKVTYNGTTTGVIAAVTDNSLHIIGVANNAAALLDMQVRCRFTG